jgi:hypothetical protein
MEYLEALVVHLLASESLNVFSDEFKISLVGFNGIAQVVFNDLFLIVSKVGTYSSNAGSALQILSVEQFINVFLERMTSTADIYIQSLQDSHQYLLKPFQVPILVNYGVDDS